MTEWDALRDAPVAELGVPALAALFERGYHGYHLPVHVDADAMRFMIRSFDLDLEASRMLVHNDAPLAFAMLGRRGANGWIGGLGVVPEARRHGLARRVMEVVIGRARALGVTTLDLEVLVQNREAIPLYETLGFRRVRDLDVWRIPPPAPVPGIDTAPIGLPDAREAIRRWRRVAEPWQRSDTSVDRFLEQGLAFEATAASAGARRLGVVLHRLSAGRVSVAQLGVEPGEESRAVPALLAALARPDATEPIRWLNLPEDDPVSPVVRALGATAEASQHEMRRHLG